MSEETKVTIEQEEKPEAPTLPETVIGMAEKFGRMERAHEETLRELGEVRAHHSEAAQVMRELREELASLRSQKDSTSRQVEELKESQMAITSQLAESSENESSDEVIPVTPMVETKMHLDIEQKPVSGKSLFQKIVFGPFGTNR